MINPYPTHWLLKNLGEVCEILDNRRIPINSIEREKRIKGKTSDYLYPYYGSTGQVGVIDDYLFEGEYVLLGEDGAPFFELNKAKAFIVTGKFWVNNHAHILRSYYCNRFLCYYLNYLDYHPYVTGTTRLKLNQSSMKQIPVLLPPLDEQRKIVEKLEELFSELDNSVASLQKAKEQIRTYRQSVLASAFSGKLISKKDIREDGLLPESWDKVKIGTVIQSIRYGTSKKCFYDKSRTPVLRIPNIVIGEINADDLKYADFTKEEINDLSLTEDDILVVRSNGSLSLVGLTARVSKKYDGYIFAGYLIRLRLKKEIIFSPYLNYLFRSRILRNQIEEKAKSTSGVNNINSKEIQDLEIPLAPIKEQKILVAEIERRFSVADKLEQTIDENLNKAELLRQSILKKAFEGKLI